MTLKRKGAWSLAILALALFLFFGVSSWFQPPPTSGTFTFELIDEHEVVQLHETLSFDLGETLYDVLQTNYELGCASSSYQLDWTCSTFLPSGKVILAIEMVTTTWTESYLAIYRNGIYATQGASQLKPHHLDVIRLVYTRT